MTITAEDKLKCVQRELMMRRRVYERRVADGEMSRDFADEQIRVMQSIVEDYEKLAQKERLL